MGDKQDFSQYKYSAMSNLVLQADRNYSARRHDEGTGDPESLASHITIRDMGSRIARENAPSKKKAKGALGVERGSIREGEDVLEREQKKRKRGEPAQLRGMGILSAADALIEGIKYRPRTPATRATYDLILTTVANGLGDVPHDVVRSAADAALETLKDEAMKDHEKKKEIDDLLGATMGSKEFNELVNLGKKITDYDAQDEDEDMDGPGADDTQGAEIDDRQGVAVVFDDESDEDEDGVARTFEVRDEDESSDEEGADMADRPEAEERAETTDVAENSRPDRTLVADDEMILDDGGMTAKKRDKDEIPASEIDAFWLQRQIGQIYSDAHAQQAKTQETLQILSAHSEDGEDKPLREIENDLMELFDYDHHDLVRKLISNKDKVVWLTRLARAEDGKATEEVERAMAADGHRAILDELRGRAKRDEGSSQRSTTKIKLDLMDIDMSNLVKGDGSAETARASGLIGGLQPKRTINLENLIFDQGNHLMTNPNVKLPQGSTKRTFKGYEEIHVPAPTRKAGVNEPNNIPISQLPDWASVPFRSAKELNRIQTRCYPTAFLDDGNMLICAPTGSGKTNVAMLTILREIGKNRNPETGEIALDDFKIVYIAPLKALVQEQVGNFGARLKPYGIQVSELTGDRQLTKQQIADTQIIVTTPEKWDVITRKATDMSYTNLVRLIIIDEIHLLHDDRGPVLESIVSRTIRKMEQTGDPVRLVGLSATLPNFRDVASFLRVDPIKGLFHFDGTYRPCPLKQVFIGVTEKKAIKQLKTMNDVAYTKVLEQVGTNRQQMLIFVHSRKETAKTAKYIRDKALEMETIGQILRSDAASREILHEEADSVNDRDLKDLLPYGFGIHHAGMNRADRTSVEDLFSQGSIQVLVCTATLAWGVNLPAHAVVIKGTQIYSPEKGSWVELSPQDVLQMLGRAGRPQYDSWGEGIIITTQSEMQYYLSLMNQQLPIESQFISKLADNLNAEVVLGNVRSRDEGVEWLGYTYLFVRMLRSPGLYSVGAEYEDDEALEQKRVDLIHSAAVVLEKSNLVKYDKKTGSLRATELGRIASHYYITHSSMLTYNHHLQSSITPIELFRVFALSDEFKYIPVRQDEKLELAKLLGRVPIPVKESIEEPHAKINVLLQAYISRLKLDGLALMADLVYVTQSAGRILRAIFEITLKKGWASVAKTALDLCKMAEKRMWPTMTPLRQFPTCPREILQKAERIDVPWSSYFDLDPPRMGELLGMPKAGRTVCGLVAKFPRLEIQAQVQPMTRSMLRVDLTITPTFEWDVALHGTAENFWIIVEDCDGEDILFHDQFLLRQTYAESESKEHLVEFTVPITEPMPPNYFITVVSDRWMHSETKLAVSFQKLILPEKFPPHTPLLDLQPLPVSAVKKPDYVALYPDWQNFNNIQTQVFNSLFTTDANVFVGAPTGSGKTVCAEFALLRHWSKSSEGRAVYLAPFQELIDHRHADWNKRLSGIAGGKKIVKLTGETSTDLRLLERGDLILATPGQWDVLSRQWQRRKNVQTVTLFIADELHMIGGHNGYVYEIVVSRMHYIALQTENHMRLLGLSVSLANARDIGEWIGATKQTIYNFSPRTRPVPLELHIQSFSIPHFPSLMLAMAKPVYLSILNLSPTKPVIIFVPSRKQARSSAADLLAACLADDEGDDSSPRFLHAPRSQIEPLLELIQERPLRESLSHGIGYYHEALSIRDRKIVTTLYAQGAIQILLASRDVCWSLAPLTAHLVIVMNTQYYEGREHRYVDYPLSDLLQMFGHASRPLLDSSSRAVLLCPATRSGHYKKFLYDALPIESHLQVYLHDAFVSEISTKMIGSTQDAVDWSTYTYLYRRLLANPSYYSLSDTSHEGLSAHLSELVETTLTDLSEAKIIDLDEEEDTITPLNPAMIAAYYNLSFITMQTFLLSLTPRTKLKGILEIVSSSLEFESLPIRRHEDSILRKIYDRVPVKMSAGGANYESPHFKAFILLQAHFGRLSLPVDLMKDQEVVLSRVLSLLSAVVDVCSSEGWINAVGAMEVSQMVVQAMWDRDSPLLQIPHFTPTSVNVCKRFGITDIFTLTTTLDPSNVDSKDLLSALALPPTNLRDAATFTNDKYPSIELDFTVLNPDDITIGEPAYLAVTLTRETDDDDDDDDDDDEDPSTEATDPPISKQKNPGRNEKDNQPIDTTVHAPFFPPANNGGKTENWWVVISEESTRSLLAIKRVVIDKRVVEMKLEFVVPEGEAEAEKKEEGDAKTKRNLKCLLMCDSYVGIDQEMEFVVEVKPGGEGEESEEGSDQAAEDEEMAG